VPHVLLVDTNGKLAFVGHPASIKLEEAIEKLLKGEALPSSAEESDDSSNYKELDVAKIRSELEAYSAKVDELSKNEDFKKNAAELARDFMVVLCETKIDQKTGKFVSMYKNINVLIGDKVAAEKMKEEITSIIKSTGISCESEWRM
jgi:hypothetical protein